MINNQEGWYCACDGLTWCGGWPAFVGWDAGKVCEAQPGQTPLPGRPGRRNQCSVHQRECYEEDTEQVEYKYKR
jgi:hypothetical protein